jgi:peroxin-7
MFDTRHPSKSVPVQAWQASPEEVLSCDWNKYDMGLIATGGKDRVVKVWDIRTGGCVEKLKGHGLAVKRVQ